MTGDMTSGRVELIGTATLQKLSVATSKLELRGKIQVLLLSWPSTRSAQRPCEYPAFLYPNALSSVDFEQCPSTFRTAWTVDAKSRSFLQPDSITQAVHHNRQLTTVAQPPLTAEIDLLSATWQLSRHFSSLGLLI